MDFQHTLERAQWHDGLESIKWALKQHKKRAKCAKRSEAKV